MEEISIKGKSIEIAWYYEEDDLDMKETGYIYKDMFKNMNFTLGITTDVSQIKKV